MLNQLKKSWNQIQSKFIQAVSITAMAIIILLKPWIAKWNENLDRELSELIKKNPDKELIIQENQNDDSNVNFNVAGSNPPTEQEVKDFFLKTRVLETDFDRKEFLQAWNEARRQPNWPPLWITILDVYEVKDDSIRTAIYIFALLDPNKKTNLGKEAWGAIEGNQKWNNAWIAICRLYTANIRLEQSKKELEQSREILRSLESITKVFEDYINTHKILFFI